LHKILDTDGNGFVDREEFVTGIEQFKIPGVMKKDANIIFEQIDIDGNQYLSVNEFGLFLEGAKLDRKQRIDQLPKNIL